MKKVVSILIFLAIVLISIYSNAMTIVLDPGHGGTDSGAIENGIYEKDVNLKIANYLKEYLQQYNNVNVIMTHNGFSGYDFTIFERAMVARNNNADLLVSLHINSSSSNNVSGSEVYVTNNTSCAKYKQETTKLGNKILNNLSKLGIKNNGVKIRLIPTDTSDVYSDGTRADYYGIIRYAMRGTMIDNGVTSVWRDGRKVQVEASRSVNVQSGEGIPTVLVEHCYIKGEDIKYLNSDSKIQALAKADADAIVAQYNLTKKGEQRQNKVNSKIQDQCLIVEPDTSAADIKKQYSGAIISDEKLSTKSSVQIGGKKYTVVKLGDANCDGVADAIDLLLIKRKLLGKVVLDKEEELSINLNNDSIIDAVDLLLMKRHLLGTNYISL